ncbi:MAG: hypothetical protein ABIR24_01995 [Verrucomicrobiota bacterium]
MKTFASQKLALCASLILGAITSSHAGYSVHTKVEATNGKNLYTWTVYNQDQSWGLDGFIMEVPQETRVLSYTVPPSYSTADGTGYWIMDERQKEMLDDHDDTVIFPAAKSGMKWLVWWGRQSPSVYPAGTSAVFTLTTDSSVQPGSVNTLAVTYTPQNNPHYYQRWNGSVTGPSIVTAKSAAPVKTFASLQTYSVFGNKNKETVDPNSTSAPAPEPTVTLNLHAGITIEGIVGRTYGIHFTDDLKNASGWQSLGSFTLSASKEIWFDPQPATQQQRFYRVMLEPAP